jgi:hypothetical protein
MRGQASAPWTCGRYAGFGRETGGFLCHRSPARNSHAAEIVKSPIPDAPSPWQFGGNWRKQPVGRQQGEAMARVADGNPCRLRRTRASLAICLGTLLFGAEPASAFSFHQTILQCRQSVGRPIVQACMGTSRITAEADRAAALAACRTKASPRVRACVQRAMIAAYGWPRVESVIEQCRQAIGRPAVNACMTAAPSGRIPDLEACRLRAAPHVRACVRRTLPTAG